MANTLEIVIKATDKASKEIQGINQHLNGLASAGGAIASGLGIAAAAAVAAAGAVGIGLGKLAVDALPLQGIEGAFAGITGNAEEMLAALREGSLGMVADKDLMMSYNQAAQLVGKQFADQLPDAMQYLSKVSAATGQDMGFMMDSLVKGVGRMSPMILDNLGIQVSLTDATDRAAAMFGVEAEELTKAQLQAGMMDVVLGKLQTNTENMPDVTGTAAQTWASLGTTFQNIKDDIGVALVPALETLMEPLGRVADKVSEFVQSEGFKEWIATATEKLGEFVTRVVDEWIPAAIETFDRLKLWFEENEGVIVGVLAAIGVALVAFGIQSAIAMAPVLIAMAPIVAIMAAVGAAAYLLYEAWTNNWGGIQEKLQGVWEKLQPVFDTIRAWLEEKIPIAMEALKTFWDETLLPVFEKMREWLGEKIPIAIQALTDFWENVLLPAIEDVWAFIQEDLIPLFESLWELLSAAGDLAITALTGLWENVLLPALEDIWEFIQDKVIPIFMDLKEKLEGPVGDALLWLKNHVLGPVETALGGISGAVQGVIGWVDSMAEKLRSISLPDWLTPGSPTPFEMGLRGISKALKDISAAQLPEFNAQLNVNRTGGAAALAVQQPLRSGNQYHLHITTSAPTENIIADFAVLQALAG